MAWAAQAELDSIKRRIEAGVRRAAEEGRFPGRPKALTPDQTAAIRLLRRNGQSQSRGGADLRRLPPDRLAGRAGGSRPGRLGIVLAGGRFAFSAGWPAHSAAASRTGVVSPGRESVDSQWKTEYKNRTGGGPGP